ncbi:hypothetical protein [Reyranella sp.]|uniref:hypothetical protein n=1 Tax=Reyranella sp. TaxID=1929291 RepID=UPI0012268F05|nr:hypothetical protein [Reyranella sp.]TAJ82894.1 MAG: hypothetical protein EPO50_24655 [Reyranella sp.]
MPDGSNFLQSSTSPALSVVTPIAPRLKGGDASIMVPTAVDQRVDVEAPDKKEKRRASQRRRYLKEKQARDARRKEMARVPSVPYRMPSLLSADWAARNITPLRLRFLLEGVINVVWRLGPDASSASEAKAARDYLARWQLLPAEINALARQIRDFKSEAEAQDVSAKCDWLQAGSGVCARQGTVGEAYLAALAAMEACVSILTEVPINYRHDGDALLETIIYTGWRVPARKRARFAERMAQFVTQRIMDEFDFKPI